MVDFFASVRDMIPEEKPMWITKTEQDPFDPAKVKDLFDRFHSEINTIKITALEIVVNSDQSYAEAQELLGTTKKLSKAIDAKRRELKEPYLAFTRILDGEANGLSNRLNEIAKDIESGKLLPYARMKEQQRREAEEAARREAAARQAELDRIAKAESDLLAAESDRLAAEAKAIAEAEGKSKEQADLAAKQAAAMAEPAPVVVPDIPKETKVTTDSATSKIEYDWDWSLLDFKSLPDDILEDRKEQIIAAIRPAVSARIKSGIRNIPGVNIFKVEKLKTRVRR